MNWNRVDEQSPDPVYEDGVKVYPWVLIYAAYHWPPYGVGYYDGTNWRSSSDYELLNITHWAPLEEPGT